MLTVMVVRSKQIPPGKGNYYLYEQRSERSGDTVGTRHVRYIGRAGGGGEVVERAADGSQVAAHATSGRQGYPPPMVKRKTVRTHTDGPAIYRIQYGKDGKLYLDVQRRGKSAGLNAPLKPGITAGAAIAHVKANKGKFLGQIIEHDGGSSPEGSQSH